MATFLIGSEININRQEGDTADIVFTMPTILDLSLFAEVKFQVKNATKSVFTKSLTDNTITVNGQTITIPLLVADTTNKAGTHRWELEISNDTPEVITIAKGNFTIIKQIIV